jgi:PAS domain S-box-containing protein
MPDSLTSLAERPSLAESAFDILYEALVILDGDRCVRRANRSFFEMFQVAEEQVLGHRLLEVLEADWDIPHLPELLRRIEQQRGDETDDDVYGAEVRARHDGQQRRSLWIRGRPFSRDGEERLTLLVMWDITKRRAAEQALAAHAEQLQAANSELEQFAYVASHDLQEPLRTIGSYCQLLEQEYESAFDERGRRWLDYIVHATDRMQQLIAGLLTYSRVTTRAEEPVPVDAGEIAAEAIAGLRTSIQETGATVECRTLPQVRVDPNQLRRVFQNLVSNAVKFHGDAPPRVTIAAEPRDDDWLFTVADNGVGIDPDFAEHAFLMFRRLHKRSEFPGSGIGLAVCKKVVERHGGTIWLEPNESTGTRVRFTLPQLKENADGDR